MKFADFKRLADTDCLGSVIRAWQYQQANGHYQVKLAGVKDWNAVITFNYSDDLIKFTEISTGASALEKRRKSKEMWYDATEVSQLLDA